MYTFYGQCPECKSILWGTDSHHEHLADRLIVSIRDRPYLHVIVMNDDTDGDMVISRHKDQCKLNGTITLSF